MHTTIIGLLAGAAWMMASFFAETWFPIGDWRWAVGAGVAVFVAFAVHLHKQWRDARKSPRSFDTPIAEAVEHYVRTVPHSYRDGADHHAFEVLHKAMSAGKLPVVGIRGEDASSERISARKCKRLEPRIVVVPRNRATPQGVRFDLMEEVGEIEPLVESRGFSGYTGLRVRSSDLYRLWPNGQGA